MQHDTHSLSCVSYFKTFNQKTMQDFTVKWEDRFNTSFQTIDNQHKKLFNLFNVFTSACIMGEDKNIVAELLFELEDYTHYHFDEEENILTKKGDGPTKKHLTQHAEFKKTLHDLKFDYVSDNKMISTELLEYIRAWLIDHIIGIDQKELIKIKQ